MRFKKRNRTDSAVSPKQMSVSIQEKELVLKLSKNELFDQHILLPHAELNSIVYTCVDAFVKKYRGDGMTLSIFTDTVNPFIQDVFREVYCSHYEDELDKVNRHIRRRYVRIIMLLIVSVGTFVISRYLTRANPTETIVSYLIANVSCFCLWEVGYTQFATRDIVDEKKRITRALRAKIEFQ